MFFSIWKPVLQLKIRFILFKNNISLHLYCLFWVFVIEYVLSKNTQLYAFKDVQEIIHYPSFFIIKEESGDDVQESIFTIFPLFSSQIKKQTRPYHNQMINGCSVPTINCAWFIVFWTDLLILVLRLFKHRELAIYTFANNRGWCSWLNGELIST